MQFCENILIRIAAKPLFCSRILGEATYKLNGRDNRLIDISDKNPDEVIMPRIKCSWGFRMGWRMVWWSHGTIFFLRHCYWQ